MELAGHSYYGAVGEDSMEFVSTRFDNSHELVVAKDLLSPHHRVVPGSAVDHVGREELGHSVEVICIDQLVVAPHYPLGGMINLV
jgi:hypothetical protein